MATELRAHARPPIPPRFTAEGRRFGPGILVALGGELDLAVLPAAESALRHAERHADLVVLDLRDLSFMDCNGLRMVIAADTRVREAAGRLVVVPGPPAVRRVFELTATTGWLHLVADPAEALTVLPGGHDAPGSTNGDVDGAGHHRGRVQVLPYAAGAGQAQVIALEGPLDAAMVAELEHAVTSALDEGRGHVIVDLLAVTAMSNATLSTLCVTLRRLRGRHATLAVVGAQPRVRTVLELVELEHVDLVANVRDALAHLDAPSMNGGPPSRTPADVA